MRKGSRVQSVIFHSYKQRLNTKQKQKVKQHVPHRGRSSELVISNQRPRKMRSEKKATKIRIELKETI